MLIQERLFSLKNTHIPLTKLKNILAKNCVVRKSEFFFPVLRLSSRKSWGTNRQMDRHISVNENNVYHYIPSHCVWLVTKSV